MRKALTSVEGVEDVQVDYASGSATVKVKEGTDPEKVAAALTGKYGGTLK